MRGIAGRALRGRLMRGIAAGLATVWLMGSPGARAEGASCAWTLAGMAKLRSDDGFITLSADVAGRAVSFLVDTGSETGLLTPHAVSALGLRPDRAHRTQLQGTGGTGRVVQNALLPPIGLEGLVLPGGSVPVGALPAMPMIAPPVAGLIGADLLSRFDLEFDLPRGRLLFWRRGSDSVVCAPPPNWPAPFDTLPMRLEGGRPVLSVRLDGREMTALLDSGARSRIVSVRAAERVGVSADVLAGDPGGINAGVDGHESTYHWHRFASLAVGRERFVRPVLTVAPIAERFDLLLGSDWFSGRDVWISYASGQVFVRGPGSPAGAAGGNVRTVRDGSR